MAERKTQYNKLKKPKLPDSVELEAKKDAEPAREVEIKPRKVIDVIVTAKNGLNVREKPIKTARVVKVLANRERVSVTEVNGEWGKIKDGWIMLEFTSYKA